MEGFQDRNVGTRWLGPEFIPKIFVKISPLHTNLFYFRYNTRCPRLHLDLERPVNNPTTTKGPRLLSTQTLLTPTGIIPSFPTGPHRTVPVIIFLRKCRGVSSWRTQETPPRSGDHPRETRILGGTGTGGRVHYPPAPHQIRTVPENSD